MPTGIHGQQFAVNRHLGRARDLGFRVSVGEGTAVTDVTDRVSGLRYSARLPGGYADCSFNLHMPLVDAMPFLVHLTPLRVTFQGQLAWEGRVQEPPRGSYGTEALTVSALGRSSELKAQKFTKLFVTTGYGRWRNTWELVTGETPPRELQQYSPGFAPDSNANPGFVAGWTDGAAVVTGNKYAWTWTPAPGWQLLRAKGSVNSIGSATDIFLILGADASLKGAAAAADESIVASRAISAGDTTFDVSLAGTSSYLRTAISYTGAGGAIGGTQMFHLHSIGIVGARTAEGAIFDPAAVTTYAVIRSLLNEFGGTAVQASDEAMQLAAILPTSIPGASLAPTYTWTDLFFDTPTTVEDAINQVNGPVGWEWGVFEDGLFYYGPIHTITTVGRVNAAADVNMKAFPPWWLQAQAQDGHRVVLTESTSDVVNEVYVYWTDTQGTRQQTYASDFTNAQNPLNQRDGSGPKQRRTGTVDIPGTSDSATATATATAYLAQYSRPQVKGEVTWNGLVAAKVQVGSTTRTQLADGSDNEALFTPLIRPGHWIEVGDAIGLVDVSWQTNRLAGVTAGQDRAAPPRLLPVRSVEVDADQGRVTCSVDSSRDVFSTTLARLQLAAA